MTREGINLHSRFFNECLLLDFVCIVGIWIFIRISLGVPFTDLTTIQLDQSGDGFKNYYTFAYHLKYYKSILFEGYIYPNVDLTTYTDSQFPFVLLFYNLEKLGVNSSSIPLAIINYLPILSIFISGLVLRRIFRDFHLSQIFQVVFTIGCIVLSPQILRIQSHYGLSFMIIFFLIVFLLIKSYRENSVIWICIYSLLISLLLFIFGFIHAYYLVVNGAFIIFFSGYIFYKKRHFHAINSVLAVFISLICFLLVFQIIDPITDRPENPYGLFAYQTKLFHLLPGHGFLGEILNGGYVKERLEEGHCYLTVLPYFIIFFFLCKGVLKCRILKNLNIHPNELSIGLFLSGFGCLMIALGAHLYIGGEWILELLPPLKQFRALGRFSWPFYYTSFIYFAIVFDRWMKNTDKGLARTTIITFLIFLLCVDAYSYHKDFGKLITKYKTKDVLHTEKSVSKLLSGKYISTDFQAMLPFPSGTEGAEKFNLKTNYFIKTRCLPYSYQTGLPMSYAIMSRMSRQHMFRMLEFANSEYGEKNTSISEFPSDKPLLLVIHNEYIDDYNDILNKGYYINEDENISLYCIEVEKVLERKEYSLTPDFIELSSHNSFSHPDSLLYFNDFDSHNANIGLDNLPGCFFNESGQSLISTWSIAEFENGEKIELSFWNKILTDKSDVPVFEVCFKDIEGEVIQTDIFRDWDLRRTEVNNNWVRYKREYRAPKDATSMELKVNGKHQFIDNLLVKSVNLNVFKKINDKDAFANHLMVKIQNYNSNE